MTNTEWQKNELARHYREMSRKEGFFSNVADFEQHHNFSAEYLQQQLEWIANGSYGAGACFALQRMMLNLSPRCNAVAHVGRFLLSSLYGKDFNGWRRLSKATQAACNSAVTAWLSDFKSGKVEFAATLEV